MFLTNKYTRWYFHIIEKALGQNRLKSEDIYYENHHIVPRCLGGTNDSENLVLLTAKEHYVVHHLLCFMCEGLTRRKMYSAFACMARSRKILPRYKLTPRQFETLRRFKALSMENIPKSAEHKKAISVSKTGKKIRYNPLSAKNFRETNPNTKRIKRFQVFYDDGTSEKITGLRPFCRDYSYDRASLHRILNGVQKRHKNIVSIHQLV